jgi:hypothetical protein
VYNSRKRQWPLFNKRRQLQTLWLIATLLTSFNSKVLRVVLLQGLAVSLVVATQDLLVSGQATSLAAALAMVWPPTVIIRLILYLLNKIYLL